MSKNTRTILVAIVAVALIGAAFFIKSFKASHPQEISRVKLERLLRDRQITSAKTSPTGYPNIYSIEGEYIQGKETRKFRATTFLEEEQIRQLLRQSTAELKMPGWTAREWIVNIAAPLVTIGLIFYLLSYQSSLGKTKKKHQVSHGPDVKFSDVAGVEEAKSEVMEVVDFLKHPKKYKQLGGKLPKGILLIGPPGTGKTMLAKAIAGEADANFFSAHGSDFNEIFVGVGAKRIREIFIQAKKNRPAIIFIDEIDCLGKKRKMDSHSELQQTNNALLAEMDGFESSEGIVVVAATNRPEDLDDALLRPGRFDRKVYVALPDRKGRRAILDVHTKEKPIRDRERALDLIAQTTSEMSGADLASLVNEAAILCAQRNLKEIPVSELEESRDKVRWGKERKSFVLKKEERELVAYHEAGHTIVNLQKSLLPPLYKVTIIPRGGSLGSTTLLPNEDQNIHSKTFLLENMVVLMGGRAAEKVFYGATTNGASGDLDSSRKLAHKMIHEWGMGEKLYYQPEQRDAEIEINKLLEAADREALEIIQAQRDNTHKLAQALLKHETLTREQVVNLLYENLDPSAELELAAN